MVPGCVGKVGSFQLIYMYSCVAVANYTNRELNVSYFELRNLKDIFLLFSQLSEEI